MRYLLDTNVFLSAAIAPNRLSALGRKLLSDPRNDLYLSAVASWEIAINHALQRLDIPDIPARWVPDRLREMNILSIDVAHRHAFGVAELPALHQDPFDRLLIAQARIEQMTLLATDRVFRDYPVDVVLWGA